MRIATIVGARPQFIKAATVSRAIQARNALSDNRLKEILIDTGQHFDDNISRMPEEINRILTDHAANLLFAPTKTAVENLKNEGMRNLYPEAGVSQCPLIAQVGDVMYDAALFYAEKSEKKASILKDLRLTRNEYVLATIHRAENVDQPENLNVIMKALNEVALRLPVVLPLHPRTKAQLRDTGDSQQFAPHPSLIIIDPVGYLDMVVLEKNAAVIATDSGGVQKEAFFHSVPYVTLRNETEWVELVRLGWNTLVPLDSSESTVAQINASLRSAPSRNEQPYGNGDSATRLLEILMQYY